MKKLNIKIIGKNNVVVQNYEEISGKYSFKELNKRILSVIISHSLSIVYLIFEGVNQRNVELVLNINKIKEHAYLFNITIEEILYV